jgi:hypothetical protein
LMQRVLSRFGYQLMRVKPIDLRNENIGLQEAAYIFQRSLGNSRPVLINVPPLALGRGLRGYSLAREGCHPLVVATRSALDSDRPQETIERILTQFSQLVQPCNVLEKLGLAPQDAPLLDAMPPSPGYMIHPWGTRVDGTAEAIRRHAERVELFCTKNNRKRGLNQSFAEAGYLGFGAMSAESVATESRRLLDLIHSIQKNGYQRHDGADGDVNTLILRSGGEFRWVVSKGGGHRAAVLAALNTIQFPIRILQIVDREEVDFWPNVRSGIFTRAGALQYFDQLFTGTLPAVNREWENLTSSLGNKVPI